jgi:hypothetical protein
MNTSSPAQENPAAASTAASMAFWTPNPLFLLGQLELARCFLNVAEVTDDAEVAGRNLALAERALKFVRERITEADSGNALFQACEELSQRTRALNS